MDFLYVTRSALDGETLSGRERTRLVVALASDLNLARAGFLTSISTEFIVGFRGTLARQVRALCLCIGRHHDSPRFDSYDSGRRREGLCNIDQHQSARAPSEGMCHADQRSRSAWHYHEVIFAREPQEAV
jgi:hypothetical protein